MIIYGSANVRYHVKLMPIDHIKHIHLKGIHCKCQALQVSVCTLILHWMMTFYAIDSLSYYRCVCVYVCICVKLEVGFKIEGAAQIRSKNSLH